MDINDELKRTELAKINSEIALNEVQTIATRHIVNFSHLTVCCG